MALAGGALIALTGVALTLHIPGQQGIGTPFRIALFVGLCLLACLVHALAVTLVRRRPTGLGLVLGVAVLLRLLVLAAPPFLSTDLYRYVWDGRVQLAGINPYLYPPAAPELQSLREEAIFPNINRPDYARTIYPPVAQMIFRAVGTVSQTPMAMKAAMALFDLMTILVLLRLLSVAGEPPAQVVVYAWHPLPIWEFAGNGHVDAAAIGFIALTLLAAVARRPAAAAFALAAAVLVKLLPVVLLPVIWRRWDWRVPAAFMATVIAAYLCYAGAGRLVLGFLPGYAAEEGVASGSGLYVLAALSRLISLPSWAGPLYLGLVAIGLLALGAWIAFSGNEVVTNNAPGQPVKTLARNAILLAGGLTVALSPHYPWYFAWLLLPCCVQPTASILYLTSAAFLIYLASYGSDILWPSLVYLPFLLLALRELTLERTPSAA